MPRKTTAEAGAKKAPYRKAAAKVTPKSTPPKSEREISILKFRRPEGRPSGYNPIYCEQVLEWGYHGKSRTWMAASIGVHRETLDNWAQEHKEFFDALTLAREYCQAHWEDLGHEGMNSMGFSAAAWSRSMAARFPADWRESKNVNHGVQSSLAEFLDGIDGKQPRIPTAA